jgi:D-alanyl-lipoteichoic acid acyltransferase DltB (MBOAT superfamily)
LTFITLTFAIFLVFVFAAYWALPSQFPRNLLIVVASYIFYGWWDWRFCLLMAGASLIDYLLGLAISSTTNIRHRRLLLVLSLSANLGLLGFFKYFNFFADSFAQMLSLVGWHASWVELRIILPVGISFYTFQTLSYTIDVYRGQLKAERNPINYLAFVSFFPQLVAGPIERATNLLPQFQSTRVFDYEEAADGCRQFLWGFCKKLILADRLGVIVDHVYADSTVHHGPTLLIATIAFAFQIYCDFSAYSDMAIGTAKLFGIRLMQNFAQPYFSRSVAEFWRRWHISLSTWFRDYVYIPLGGNRVSRVVQARNILITFGLSGLWHGASWNFLIWGLLNGLFVLPQMLFPKMNANQSREILEQNSLRQTLKIVVSMLVTFFLISITWVFFRAPTLESSIDILNRMATETFNRSYWHEVAVSYSGDQLKLLWLLIGFFTIEWLTRRYPHPFANPLLARLWLPVRWAAFTAIFWTAILMTNQERTGSFIYFQF